jgi:import receptor subunit TOM22
MWYQCMRTTFAHTIYCTEATQTQWPGSPCTIKVARTFGRTEPHSIPPSSISPKLDLFPGRYFSLSPFSFSKNLTITDLQRPPLDSEISSSSDLDTDYTEPDETLTDRIIALKDIIPPRARARIVSTTSSIYSFTGSAITYGGKGLWVLATSAFLLGIPYALALGQEQEIMEEEKRQGMMSEGASALLQPGEAAGEVKQSL